MSERSGTDRDSPTVATVATDRLRLRPWRREDVPAYARIIRDPEVTRHLGSGVRYRVKRTMASALAAVSDIEARRELRTMTRHWQRHGFGLWAVEEKASGALLGSVGLTVLDDWQRRPVKHRARLAALTSVLGARPGPRSRPRLPRLRVRRSAAAANRQCDPGAELAFRTAHPGPRILLHGTDPLETQRRRLVRDGSEHVGEKVARRLNRGFWRSGSKFGSIRATPA